MNWNDLLSAALDIGEQMQVSGAEIYRVEDCISRLCRAYGAIDVDVTAITSTIILTIQDPSGHRWSQTRRIEKLAMNLDRIDLLNRLSREMCETKMSYKDFSLHFNHIMSIKRYPPWAECLCYALIAGSLTVLVGGMGRDALVSALMAVVLKAVVHGNIRLGFNKVFSSVISAFAVSSLGFIAVWLGLAVSAEFVIIGNLMLLIPGSALTNSLRDMIAGDTMSGLLRFMEACIVAFALASGYILAGFVFGGIS